MAPHRLGVFGGTFDPIHIGHLVAAAETLDAFGLDGVLFVPAGKPWQKADHAHPEDRFLMTVLGTSSHAGFSVSRLELDRNGPTYTVDTMSALRGFYGSQTKLYFIAGADAVLGLGTWHRFEALKELAEVIALARPSFDLDELDLPQSWPAVNALEIPGIDVSSSAIRERVRRGRSIDYLVPEPVAQFIREKGLYFDGAASSASEGRSA